MNAAIIAAVIAAIVALAGVGATLVTSIRNLNQQRDALQKTLAEQQVQTLNERFATAADKLGNDKPPAVQLAGVYAMAGLADDWKEDRQAQQVCINVLCGYLRMPYEPDPGPTAPPEKRREFQGSREVRHAVIRVITEHLRDPELRSDRKVAGVTKQVAPVSWRGRNFDFQGVVFDGGTFSDACFSGGKVDFSDAEFCCDVSFHHANFSGGLVDFHRVKFSSGTVEFHDAKLSGSVIGFDDAEFSGGEVNFDRAEFSGGEVSFPRAELSRSVVGFGDAKFSGGKVNFGEAKFSGGTVSFGGARFCGGTVDFEGAEFSGGEVDFSDAGDWSHPPAFDWDTSPPGVKLPAAVDGASR